KRGAAALAGAGGEVGVPRVVFNPVAVVYGVAEGAPNFGGGAVGGCGAVGESKIRAEGLVRASGLETVIIRPKTFIGPERLGVFEILFDWIREGRRIPVLGSGDNRYQLLAVEDLVDAILRASQADVAGEVFNVGATDFGTVRTDLDALIAHAGTTAKLRPVPARPAEIVLRG